MRSTLFAGLALLLGVPQPASAQPVEVVVEEPQVDLEVVLPAPPQEAPAPVSVAARLRERVSGHGRWVHLPGYGEVWKPHVEIVGPSFRPYATGGRWVQTNAGWSFESEWPWGEVVFHYGRWHRTPRHGWFWVPGTEWAPAWWDPPRRVRAVVHHYPRRYYARHRVYHPRRYPPYRRVYPRVTHHPRRVQRRAVHYYPRERRVHPRPVHPRRRYRAPERRMIHRHAPQRTYRSNRHRRRGGRA